MVYGRCAANHYDVLHCGQEAILPADAIGYTQPNTDGHGNRDAHTYCDSNPDRDTNADE